MTREQKDARIAEIRRELGEDFLTQEELLALPEEQLFARIALMKELLELMPDETEAMAGMFGHGVLGGALGPHRPK